MYTNKICYILILFLPYATVLINSNCDPYNIKVILKSKYLIGKDLSAFDLYNLNLENVDFSRTKLIKTKFSFSNLKNSIFVNADLREADLSAADLTGADLRGANLRKADARGAVFIKANLIDAYFYDADLSGASLQDALFIDTAGAVVTDVDIVAMISQKKIINFIHLRNANLSGTAVSIKLKRFIEMQNVKNFDKIVWVQ